MKLAFADPAKLAAHPDVDLVTVSVKVPDHYQPVMAAIDAGKHVYCEWPLGRDTAEAIRLRDAAKRKGIRHAVGLQGQVSPAINYVKDLIAEGHIGRVLSGTLFVNAGNWGKTIERAYQADRANGANLMTITGGHNLDLLCHCLGEFRELSAFAVSQRDHIPLQGTGEMIAKNVPDQLVVSGIVGDGAVVSCQVRGGMTRGHEFLFEIHGEDGDLVLAATSRASTQRQELTVRGARGAGEPLADMAIPAKYRWVPDGVPEGSPYNVAQLYARLGEGIRNGTPVVRNTTNSAAAQRRRGRSRRGRAGWIFRGIRHQAADRTQPREVVRLGWIPDVRMLGDPSGVSTGGRLPLVHNSRTSQ